MKIIVPHRTHSYLLTEEPEHLVATPVDRDTGESTFSPPWYPKGYIPPLPVRFPLTQDRQIVTPRDPEGQEWVDTLIAHGCATQMYSGIILSALVYTSTVSRDCTFPTSHVVRHITELLFCHPDSSVEAITQTAGFHALDIESLVFEIRASGYEWCSFCNRLYGSGDLNEKEGKPSCENCNN